VRVPVPNGARKARPLVGRALVLLGLQLVVPGCSTSAPPESVTPEPIVHEARGRAFGSSWHVRWVEPRRAAPDPRSVVAAIEGALAQVDLGMSTWREDSELSRARAAGGPVAVSEETAAVVREALALAEATGGAFDPTVQPLMELWGFHGTARASWPTANEIAQTRERVGWRRVQLGRDRAGRPMLDTGGAALDLSAIAKGHGVDRALHAVSSLGIGSAFVEVGGEVRAVGDAPSGRGWRVGVNLPDPAASPQDLALVVEFTNAAVATSGNYRNAVVLDGRSVGHTMDPRTGEPAQTSVRSATVLAPDCRLADGVATALMVLSYDDGARWVESLPDVEAAWLIQADAGLELRVSAGLPVDTEGARTVRIVHDSVRRPAAP